MMETNRHEKSGGSAFLWGLIIGALFATLITHKRGRLILKEIVNLGIELVENFVEERTSKNHESGIMNQDPVVETRTNLDQEDISQAAEDIKSEVVQDETPPIDDNIEGEVTSEIKSNGNGHHKKRLFRGIRKSK